MYRRRIHNLTQLNRGEGRHEVVRAVFSGQVGEIRKSYREGQEPMTLDEFLSGCQADLERFAKAVRRDIDGVWPETMRCSDWWEQFTTFIDR